MKAQVLNEKRRARRKLSVRSHIRRTADRPRLSVHRSTKHIYAQVIDDLTGRTIAAASSTSKAFESQYAGKSKSERAAAVGAELARKAKDAGIEKVVFDRGCASFHGRVKALAEAARQGGLVF